MRSLLPKFRFLPLMLIIVGGIATMKSALIWNDLAVAFEAASPVGVAFAADAQPAAEHDKAEEAGHIEPPSPSQSPSQALPHASADAASESGAVSRPGTLSADGGSDFSEEELAVLQKLAERRDALNARNREIGRREAVLHAAEARIDQKIARLEELQASLETLVEQHDAEQEGKLTSLVKIYENMKPKDAARIFEELDMKTLLPVAERMKERKLAAIMAQMNPSKAKEMTVELAQLRRLIDQSSAFPLPQG